MTFWQLIGICAVGGFLGYLVVDAFRSQRRSETAHIDALLSRIEAQCRPLGRVA